MLYLYVKTHNKTGLKYLGKTQRKDPHKYPGSGKYWTRHLKKHGYDYTTEILLETNSKSELEKVGIYYSNLWNIVDSQEWANLKIEQGDGGWDHINSNQDLFFDFEKRKKRFSEIGKNNKDTVSVVDEFGNKFRVAINDPRYISGELKGHTVGKVAAYNAKGELFYVNKDDPRILNGDLRSNNSGKIYITNGIDRKLIKPTENIPPGWYKGDNRQKYNLGKIWITDGNISRMIFKTDPIPTGYHKGRTF